MGVIHRRYSVSSMRVVCDLFGLSTLLTACY